MIDQYIQQYGRRLYGLCRSLCSSPYDADDLYQETWLRVVKHISQYDPSREFEPWLTRICVNTYRSITPELEHRKSGYVERKRRPYQGNVVRIA